MSVHRYKVLWTGFSGAPGYTTFHFKYPTEPGTTPTISAALTTWANAIKSLIPGGVYLQADPTYEVLDEATGTLLDILSEGTGPGSVQGTNINPYSSATGACASFGTDVVTAGRRVRGRQFLVPLGGGAFETGGTLWSGATPIILNAYTALMSDTSLAPLSVWHRPVAGAGGVLAPVTSVRVNDAGAVLTSRRD